MQNKTEKAPTNIFLVGLMGAGKTTVGKVLAQQLHKTFFDADHEIESRTGVKIPIIFEIEGEEGFRERESRMLQELAAHDGVVVATGGGAVSRPANRELLRRCGIVIYLKASVNDLWLRTRHDKNRPLLQCDDPRGKLSILFAERDALYQETADIVVSTGNQSIKNLVQQIEVQLAQYRTNAQSTHTSQQSLTVALGERSYPIAIGAQLLQDGRRILPYLAQKKVAIVTNTTVAPLYLDTLRNALVSQGVETVTIVLPDGEAHKNWETLNQIFDALLQYRCERKTTLIALGGGVIGDLTGFAAATYLRGVPFIQIPTTLLAQVDSSVGGKTGINHPLGKNMIGAFYQPKLVLADIATLNTLPKRELAAGIAEVIKYGLIRDLPFFEWLEQNIAKLVARDPEVLIYAIHYSCKNKAEVVAEDEHESGVRALLNLGHTFGHAIEAGMGYGAWLHGEAVAAGTVLAANLSHQMGLLGESDLARVKAIYRAAGLPIVAPDLGVSRYLELMELDKKVEGGKIRFVLLKAIGEAFVSADVPANLLSATLTSRGTDD